MATNQELINSINENISRLYNNSLGGGGNLLINPDFKINQRGLSEYSTIGYTVDRMTMHYPTKAEITENGIKIHNINALTNLAWLIQMIEFLPADTYTLTVKLRKSRANMSVRVHSTGTKNTTEWQTVTAKLTTTADRSSDYQLQIATTDYDPNALADDWIEIAWAKLELGNVATPFVAPDHTTELVKCKRYFERLTFNDGWTFNITGYQWGAATPVNMVAYTIPYQTKRIVPTINLSPNTGRFCCCRPTSTVCGLGEINRYPFIAVDHCAVEQYLQTSTPEVTSGWIDAIGNVDIDAEIY